MAWVKVKWIDPMFAALNTVAPNRDKGSDGTIGDLAHASGKSGHNPDDTPGVQAERQDADSKQEVRAADADADLRQPGITMQRVVDAILAYPPDRDRLIYIIFNGYIWSASNGWRRAPYTGSDKHREHMHASGNPVADEDGRPWLSILNLGEDMGAVQAESQAFNDLIYGVDALLKGVDVAARVNPDGTTSKARVNVLAQQQKAILAGQAAVIKAIDEAEGDLDTAVILRRIDEAAKAVADEARDAVGDLGEGGAKQVREDAP